MDPKFNRKDFTHNSNIETSSMFICPKILHTWTLAQDHVILLNPLQTYKSGHLSLLINHIIFDNLYFWLYLVTSRSMLCGLLFFRERERRRQPYVDVIEGHITLDQSRELTCLWTRAMGQVILPPVKLFFIVYSSWLSLMLHLDHTIHLERQLHLDRCLLLLSLIEKTPSLNLT